MADVVGSVAYEVIAEFDNEGLAKNVAEGADRARDTLGRFVKEHRTITETMMDNFGSIIAEGTTSATGVIGREMNKAADQAGDSFLARMSASFGAIPGALGTALSTGLVSVATAAMRTAGEAASEAFAERVRGSAPYWKKAFTMAFTGAADPGVNELVSSASEKVSSLGDNFTRAGIMASESLGTALAGAANIIQPALAPALEAARSAMSRFQEIAAQGGSRASDALVRGVSAVATRIAPALGRMSSAAANALQTGMQRAGELGQRALQLPFGKVLGAGLGAALAGAIAVGGAKLISGAAKVGVSAATGLMRAVGNGIKGLGRLIASGVSAAASAVASAAKALGGLIVQGISSAAGAVANAARAVGAGAAKAMGDALKLGVNMAGTAIAGILGTSLTKGFGRLTAIDNAEASLRGLAATANHVPEIMDAATNAVTGTAFGLDQAATAAAQFAAARVPINDMERHLGALANAAAAAGGDFDGMSDIFAKVAAKGTVTGEVMNQLTSRGLSGLQALADYFGVTAEEAQAMVSNSEVSFDDFSRAMDKAMGKVAIEQATTFQGLMANVGAAMGRLGAVMQKPIFDATKAALPGVMNLFDQFKNVIEPLADIIADRLIPFAEKLGKAMEGLSFDAPAASADKLFGSLAFLAPVIGGLAAAFAGPLLTSIPVVGGLFAGLTGPVGILTGALIGLLAVDPSTLLSGFNTVMGALPSILDGIVKLAVETVPKMAQGIMANAPLMIMGFADMFTQIITTVAGMAPLLVTTITQALTSVVSALITAAPMLIEAGIQLITGLVEGLVLAIPQIVPVAVDGVTMLLEALVNAAPLLIGAGLQLVTGLITGIFQALPQIIPAAVQAVVSLTETIIAALPLLIEAGLQILMGLVEGIFQALPMLIEAAPQIIMTLVTTILEALPMLIEMGAQLLVALITGLAEAIPQLIDTITGLIPVLVTTLLEALPLIIDAAMQLFIGIGLGVLQALPDIIQSLLDLLPVLIETIIGMLPDIISSAIQLFLGIQFGLLEAIPQILFALIGMLPQIISIIIGLGPQLIRAAFAVFLGIVQGIGQAAGSIIPRIARLGADMINKVKSFVGDMIGAAGDLIRGLASGIANQAGAVIDAIVGVASNAVSAFKNFLGIKSPSRLMMGFGEDIGEGLAIGVRSMQSRVSSELGNLIPSNINTSVGLNGSVSSSGRGGASTATGGVTAPALAPEMVAFDPRQPVEFTVVDVDGQVLLAIRSEIGKALRGGSRSSIRAEFGVGR